jgi:hypothetical protein
VLCAADISALLWPMSNKNCGQCPMMEQIEPSWSFLMGFRKSRFGAFEIAFCAIRFLLFNLSAHDHAATGRS